VFQEFHAGRYFQVLVSRTGGVAMAATLTVGVKAKFSGQAVTGISFEHFSRPAVAIAPGFGAKRDLQPGRERLFEPLAFWQ